MVWQTLGSRMAKTEQNRTALQPTCSITNQVLLTMPYAMHHKKSPFNTAHSPIEGLLHTYEVLTCKV